VLRKLPEVTANIAKIMQGSKYFISSTSLTITADISLLGEFWITKHESQNRFTECNGSSFLLQLRSQGIPNSDSHLMTLLWQ
jgi:hypothetical protein